MVLAGMKLIFFIEKGWCDAVLWIFEENSGYNSPMFLVVAEKYLHRAKDFSASWAALPGSRLGVHEMLWENTARTGNPAWWKGYLTPSGVMLSSKNWGKEVGDIWNDGICLPKEAIHTVSPPFLEAAELLPAHGLVANEFLLLLCMCIHLLLYIENCLYLNLWVLTLLFFWFSPSSHLRRVSESCVEGLKHNAAARKKVFDLLKISTRKVVIAWEERR